VIVVLDASTLINLDNGGVFAIVVSVPGRSFQVSAEVLRESRTVARAIRNAVEGGHVHLVDDSAIDAQDFKDALADWELGPGETECILAAKALGCAVACDDGAARRVIEREIGVSRMTGTVGLLREVIAAGLMTSEAAFEAYQQMKRLGGFLPRLTPADFQP
jgi:predicted nucleic acid-binding protein